MVKLTTKDAKERQLNIADFQLAIADFLTLYIDDLSRKLAIGNRQSAINLRIANKFFDATTATTEDLTPGIPVSEGEHFVSRRIVWLANFAFGIFGAAVFAEPAVAQVKKVIGLIQDSGGFGEGFGAGLIYQTGTC